MRASRSYSVRGKRRAVSKVLQGIYQGCVGSVQGNARRERRGSVKDTRL